MAIDNQNWTCYPGETVTLTVILTNVLNGQALAITLRDRPGGTVVLTKAATATTAGATVTGTFTLTPADTGTALGPGTYDWDCERTTPGAEAVLSTGILTVKKK